MGKDEEFEARISALEGEVAMLRRVEEEIPALRRETVEAVRNASAAQVLAQAADRDAADVRVVLRGQQRLLNALRETQVEQGQQISEQGRQIDSLRSEMRAGFAEVRSELREAFTKVNLGMSQIVALLAAKEREEGAPDSAAE
ncbi:hypothetical protein [Nocardia arthritidis]|uniref:Uncharacterized protein n=1 Tax=Nocardia arthritidis TaxID=228602 RepID=A0A6G9YDC2_9NOCA|nr:hypothetical protein [Nocardia arthritidis]QIS11130.1 hypothetical protein F5544_16255 [Nocardia arthritidis]